MVTVQSTVDTGHEVKIARVVYCSSDLGGFPCPIWKAPQNLCLRHNNLFLLLISLLFATMSLLSYPFLFLLFVFLPKHVQLYMPGIMSCLHSFNSYWIIFIPPFTPEYLTTEYGLIQRNPVVFEEIPSETSCLNKSLVLNDFLDWNEKKL